MMYHDGSYTLTDVVVAINSLYLELFPLATVSNPVRSAYTGSVSRAMRDVFAAAFVADFNRDDARVVLLLKAYRYMEEYE